MKNNKFFKGALILIICNLIGKVLGAVYRIPLAGIIGSEGIGQYQLTFCYNRKALITKIDAYSYSKSILIFYLLL